MKAPRPSVQWLVVIALSIAAFIPAATGGLVSDDHNLIGVESRDLGAALLGRFWQVRGQAEISGIYAGAYRPLTQLFYALEQRVFGDEPIWFHLVSLSLHALNAWLVLRLLARRVRKSGETLAPEAELAVLLGAVLFAVHPAHAESVAWISGATDLLMTLCLLAALELLERGPIARVCALFAFACAAFAKEPAVVAPALCLLDGWARGLPRARLRGDVLLAGGGALIALAGIAAAGRGHEQAPIQIGFLHALVLTGHYVRAALWPAHLSVSALPYRVGAAGIYEDPLIAALGGAAWCLWLLGLAVGVRSARARRSCADGAWFCLLLLPIVLLLQLTFSDRFLYAPLIGLCALLVRGLSALISAPRAVRYAAFAAASAAIAIALPRSVDASRAFLGDEALWGSQVRVYPDNPKARDALAEALVARGEHEQARRHLERGLSAAAAIDQRALALHFIAHLIALPTLARPEWDQAARVDTQHGCSELFDAHRVQYESAQVSVRFDVAPSELRALEAPPELLLVPCALALLELRRFADAVRIAERAIAVAPGDVAAAEIHALALARSGAYAQAQAEVERALQLRELPKLHALARAIDAAAALARAAIPAGDHKALALNRFQIEMALGSPFSGRAAVEPALRETPADPELVRAWVESYVAEGRFELGERAIAEAERAAPGDPRWAQIAQELRAAEAELRAQPVSTRR